MKKNAIENNTKEQLASNMCSKERTCRFTTCKLKAVTKRQGNNGSFAESIMHLKPFSSKYVAHGIKYEHIALQE